MLAEQIHESSPVSVAAELGKSTALDKPTENLTGITLIASTVVAAVSLGVFLGGRHDSQVIAIGSISSGYAATIRRRVAS